MALIQVSQASKTFVRQTAPNEGDRSFKALNNVSFTMESPEIIALIGPSGSGKSTLLKTISGLILTDKEAGRVEVNSLLVQNKGRLSADVRKARANIGYIAQSFNLVGRLSLFTNVALGLLGRVPFWRGLFGFWTSAEKQQIMAALEKVRIADRAAQRANSLSGGQQQRGAIARALVQKAKIVLADEPIAALDPVTARKVMDHLVALNTDYKAGVVITLHQVDYALKYCTRIIALKAGQIVYDGPRSGLKMQDLRDIYGDEIEDAIWGEVSSIA